MTTGTAGVALDRARPGASAFVLHHLGVAVGNLEQSLEVYRELFGYGLLSGPFADAIQRVSVCFVGSGRAGEPPVELVAPAGENSPIANTLRKGIGAYHVCYEVVDLDAAVEFVRSRGCVVIGKATPAAAFEGRRISWFYTTTRQLVELLEAEDGTRGDEER
jgi:methylmalonyl-CoA/ethylmalonyl-CoA epimerase